ncbi:MAG: hypothetical protein GEV13_05320 [Rhodospirillales bacterium]|nr:hypothetical protein [Rhodospirillales bacterium]
MGVEILSLLGLSSVFGLIGLVLAGWMAWRIVEKTGLPGWAGLSAILLTLTGVGTIVPLILLWVFAFMRWPRDEMAGVALGTSSPARPASPSALPPPPAAVADRRAWRLSGSLSSGGTVTLTVDGSVPAYLLTGAAAAQANELSVPDPSVGQPHARLLSAAGRLGLEDLGTAGSTFIDGARLLPEHGPRDISAARAIRLGSVELALSRA